jgi:hypothetical protein
MAKDDRLYARFDIAMDEHPKIMLLSDAAFRALFESTMYSRRQLTDGFLPVRVVLRKWGQAVADELTSNDPEKPSWVPTERDGTPGFRIHDYEKHQTTTADISAKREAGRLGGLAKASKTASTPLAPARKVLEQNPGTSLAKTETETETTTSKEVVPQRGHRIPEDFAVTAEMVAWAKEKAPAVDGKLATERFKNHFEAMTGRGSTKLDWVKAWRNWLLSDQLKAVERGWKPSTSSKPMTTAELKARQAEVMSRAG